MIILIVICLLFYGALGTLAYVCAKRRNAFFWSDAASPLLVVVLWVALTSSGYGYQSLSHIVELPIALICALLLLYLRVFIVDRFNENYRYNSYAVMGLSLVFVFFIRTFMPYLPE